MIERYQTKEMAEIWSEESQYQSWLEVELAACRAWMELGVIPEEDFRQIEEKASFDVGRIKEIERVVQHDMIAFVSNVAENVGGAGRYIHLGLTSSDVLDTASALRLKKATSTLLDSLETLRRSVLDRAWTFKDALCVGRTHGVHAEPMTFGLKLLNWYDQLGRDAKRLEMAREEISWGKISGAVGTYAHCPPEIEARACAVLGLRPAAVSNQILQRDAHAHLLAVLAIMGTAVERIALEVRHLQRTEVLEVLEPFGKGQKGSSAMPHKRNPITCERLCGMARLLRGYAQVAMENVALWHERDISHSSTERVIWPDAFHIAHYMLKTVQRIVVGMEVDVKRMEENLNLTKGLIFSQSALLTLVDAGMARDEAYAVVQEDAMRAFKDGIPFIDVLKADERIITRVKESDLERALDPKRYLKHIDDIFGRFPRPE
ncbi:MAG: adenylosuccinate lyase [Synergistales bacterium]|nr:adenylosuccinate lyase [Synergistales bacterium]